MRTAAFWSWAMLAVLATHPLAAQQPPVKASGGFYLAKTLYTSCISTDATEKLLCQVYLQGVADTMIFHKDNRWAPPTLCNTGQLQAGQLGPIVVTYLQRNPQQLEGTAAAAAFNALAEKFPCPAGK